MIKFNGYKKEYFLNGLTTLQENDRDELLNYAQFIDYKNETSPSTYDFDIESEMSFATGDNSEFKLYTYNGFPYKFKAVLYGQTFESNESYSRKLDCTYLREVVMLLDYCATTLTKVSELEGYDKAQNSDLNKLMGDLKNYLYEAVRGKEPKRLDIDFKKVIGERNYTNLQNKCKLKGLKAYCIGEGLIPPESDEIKYPDNYDKFCKLLPEIEAAYTGIDKQDKAINWNKNIQPFTVADLQKKLYEERRSLRGLRKKVRSHESYEGKSEEEKQLVKAELKTAILKSKAVVSKTRYDLAMVSKEIKLSERKFKVDRTVAMAKIKAILAKNIWTDFQK